jgi:GNAT superfamily N-acetyltransferase
MVRACAVPVLLLALLTSPAVNAQPVDHGLLAHERVRQQQVQGLVVPPPATITAPTPAQPRVDAGGAISSTGSEAAGAWQGLPANHCQTAVIIVPERMTEGTWNRYLIAVHPDVQGTGVGTAMLHHIEQLLATRGERVLLVETSGLDSFARTRQFYLKANYEQEARIRDFYQAGEDKIVFRKALMAR